MWTTFRIVTLLARALIQRLKINTMLQSTLVDKIPLWDAIVVIEKTVRKSQRPYDWRPGVYSVEGHLVRRGRERQVRRTKHKHVTNTFCWAMLAHNVGISFGSTDYSTALVVSFRDLRYRETFLWRQHTYFAMNESWKSTLSLTCSIAGKTSFCKQY